jgi:hypothetical protein
MSAALLAPDGVRIGFECFERCLTDSTLISVGGLLLLCLSWPECFESVEKSHTISPCQLVEEGMDPSEGRGSSNSVLLQCSQVSGAPRILPKRPLVTALPHWVHFHVLLILVRSVCGQLKHVAISHGSREALSMERVLLAIEDGTGIAAALVIIIRHHRRSSPC